MSDPFPAAVPTREVISILRYAGSKLGLSAQILRTAEMLLSILPPRRNHHMIFASNETLVARAQGLHERSLRRHISALIEAGLLARSDSPNRKRYCCHDPAAGRTLRFGLDLSPIFARLSELTALAEDARAEADQLSYLRKKLRAAAHQRLIADSEDSFAQEAIRAARRKITATELQGYLDILPALSEAESLPVQTEVLADNAGQNDRHHLSLNKEYIDKNEEETLIELNQCSPEALSYSIGPIRTVEDVTHHASVLAPMLGITSSLYHQAVSARGVWAIASLIWMIVEEGSRILQPTAYFRSLALGPKAASYKAWTWLKRRKHLSFEKPMALSADNVCKIGLS